MFTNPKENLKELRLGAGMVVADFGSGGGGYSLPAAKEVKDGKVYAIDVQRSLLEKIQNDAMAQGIPNIEIIWADLDKPRSTNLRPSSIDVAIASNLLFLLEEKEIFVEELKEVLRPGGRVLVVDWVDSFGGLGPQPENIFGEDVAKKLFESKGFVIERTLLNAGDHHYGFIAKIEK